MAIKVITVGEKILGKNEDKAKENKKLLDKHGILTVNIMSSPGAGKTSLILSTIKQMSKKWRLAVIEGDVASSVDAEKVNAAGIPVVQINTAGGCHLDAFMVADALENLPLEKTDLMFIENVGNLICPNNYLLGEDIRLMIASMPEGDDKPIKYPAMFADSDVVIINKVDLQPYIDFNEKAFRKVVTGLNPDVIIFPVSCKTGMGLEAWFTWLDKSLKAKKNK
ncbi:MAG: hydrogenase nickel incorporation protein HypB [Dehalococcoidales bacterium]|jgi:hydrogenase nickel incorporation protein HypB